MSNTTLLTDLNLYEDNNIIQTSPYTGPHALQPLQISSYPIQQNEPTVINKVEIDNVPSPIEQNVDYVAMSYKIATLLRRADPETYKQCSRFYRNDNSMYMIVIVFLLLICLYMSRFVKNGD